MRLSVGFIHNLDKMYISDGEKNGRNAKREGRLQIYFLTDYLIYCDCK